MTIEEIRQTITDSLPLRVPRFAPDTPARERVAALENYLLESAYHSGALVEARHWLRKLEDRLGREVEELEGWEPMLASRPSTAPKAPTKADIAAAKRRAAPQLFAAGRECRQLRGSVDDQIERFKFEDQFVISRAYSMISGS